MPVLRSVTLPTKRNLSGHLPQMLETNWQFPSLLEQEPLKPNLDEFQDRPVSFVQDNQKSHREYR